ncbi:hypothetical protein [Nocardioides panacihumi]|uniref:hypothetical protein n=1 Tax=Nocardioides panacihumi TaxID=400774 RepID=UPI0031DED860
MRPVFEAFWNDGGSFEFIAHHPGTVPFAVVERLLAEARRNLQRPLKSPEGGLTAVRSSPDPVAPDRGE